MTIIENAWQTTGSTAAIPALIQGELRHPSVAEAFGPGSGLSPASDAAVLSAGGEIQ